MVLAQQALVDRLQVDVLPYLGSHPSMGDVLAKQIQCETIQQGWSADATVSAPHVILMAHGSRRAGGNQPIEAIAADLDATPAYWFVDPKLPDQLRMMLNKDSRPILVIPYFLFAGGITDAIANSIEQIKIENDSISIALGKPLGDNPDLASLITQTLAQEIALDLGQKTEKMSQKLILSATLKH